MFGFIDVNDNNPIEVWNSKGRVDNFCGDHTKVMGALTQIR